MQEPQTPIRAKLKLSGLNGTQLKAALSPRTKLDSTSKRDRCIVPDVGGYDVVAPSDARSLRSDSSSETSEKIRESRQNTPNNPPLKYNRAFR